MYEIAEQTVCIEDETVSTYGIVFDGGGIADISTDRDRVLELVGLLNRCGVSTLHIEDVVDDFLAE